MCYKIVDFLIIFCNIVPGIIKLCEQKSRKYSRGLLMEFMFAFHHKLVA